MNTHELYDECHRLFNYDAETGLLTRKVRVGKKVKVGDIVGCVNTKGYLVVRISGKLYSNHRTIWLMQTGEMPKEHIDHINGDKTDNRLVNLREATNAENLRNRGKQSNNASGFKGVCVDSRRSKSPYRTKIMFNGMTIDIGHFTTPEQAHQAYCNKAKELHGDFYNSGMING